MDKYLKSVKEFHDAFGVETPKTPDFPYTSKWVLDYFAEVAKAMDLIATELHGCAKENKRNILLLRLQLIQEELGELAEAFNEESLLGALDALVDLQYVISGTVLTLGLQDVFDAAFDEVHRSNMSKLENGKPLTDEAGRIKKGKDYFKPNLQQFLSDHD